MKMNAPAVTCSASAPSHARVIDLSLPDSLALNEVTDVSRSTDILGWFVTLSCRSLLAVSFDIAWTTVT